MAVAVLADAHLGGPGGPAGPLIEQLRALPEQGCTRLVLLGDLFQAWIGQPQVRDPRDRRRGRRAARAAPARPARRLHRGQPRLLPRRQRLRRRLRLDRPRGGVRGRRRALARGPRRRPQRPRPAVSLLALAVEERALALARPLDPGALRPPLRRPRRGPPLAHQLQAQAGDPGGRDPRLRRAPPGRGARRAPPRPFPRGAAVAGGGGAGVAARGVVFRAAGGVVGGGGRPSQGY